MSGRGSPTPSRSSHGPGLKLTDSCASTRAVVRATPQVTMTAMRFKRKVFFISPPRKSQRMCLPWTRLQADDVEAIEETLEKTALGNQRPEWHRSQRYDLHRVAEAVEPIVEINLLTQRQRGNIADEEMATRTVGEIEFIGQHGDIWWERAQARHL